MDRACTVVRGLEEGILSPKVRNVSCIICGNIFLSFLFFVCVTCDLFLAVFPFQRTGRPVEG